MPKKFIIGCIIWMLLTRPSYVGSSLRNTLVWLLFLGLTLAFIIGVYYGF
jgi:hypothetical protein